MKINYLLLGEKIKKIRRRKNLSQSTLAELVNVSISYISRVECGKDHISIDLLVNVCEALETNVDEILTKNHFDEYSYLMKESTDLEKKLIIAVCDAITEIIRKENMQ